MGVACDGQPALPPSAPTPLEAPRALSPESLPPVGDQWEALARLGSIFQVRSSFPRRLRRLGTAVPGSQARSWRGGCAERIRSGRPPHRTSPARGGRTLGSASPARVCEAGPPSFPHRHTRELKTESWAHRPEVAETWEVGWAPLGGTLWHPQAHLRVRVRVRGPLSPLVLLPAPQRPGAWWRATLN